ncbi:MAG: hypothetical protein HY835_08000 [Anaerolineae bacterium]|nr:hypothetical protein [Anaerolineae bacterium]
MDASISRFLKTAGVDMVYGKPVKVGDTTIIPTAEVLTYMGFGVGAGGGHAVDNKAVDEQGEPKSMGDAGGSGAGGGGGGKTFSRPVAVVVATPQGVEVKPIVDWTKIALALLTAWGFMGGMAIRMRRGMRRPGN